MKLARMGGAVVKELLKEPLAYVLTGNGGRDIGTLEEICEKYRKYDHGSIIVYPQYMFKTGLKVTELLAKLFDMERRTLRFLILLDKEHLRSIEDFEEALKDCAFTILDKVTCSCECCWKINIKKGEKQGIIILSIQGKNKSIEENYAELIKLLSGENVEANKESIKKWFKDHGVSGYRELIRNAKVEILEKAFTPLTCAIKTLLQLQNTTND
jgi:hypothetical protein